jgi:hypothetical protein
MPSVPLDIPGVLLNMLLNCPLPVYSLLVCVFYSQPILVYHISLLAIISMHQLLINKFRRLLELIQHLQCICGSCMKQYKHSNSLAKLEPSIKKCQSSCCLN